MIFYSFFNYPFYSFLFSIFNGLFSNAFMKNYHSYIYLSSFCFRVHVISKASIILTALTNAGTPTVTLQWNMVNYPGSTAYILFKSIDGVVWEITAANPVFRNYTSSTILAYRDNFSDEQKLYYRVKVYDTNENIVEVSNTAVVQIPVKADLI